MALPLNGAWHLIKHDRQIGRLSKETHHLAHFGVLATTRQIQHFKTQFPSRFCFAGFKTVTLNNSHHLIRGTYILFAHAEQ